ncbi:hypothetical protein AB0B39_07610 [Micromonospora sp. NPDC049114]|uniref:hypothetical protein n=1 Tax=unclassified Micromonospora TaxID=2617518 RepID=UPI0033E146C8
MSEDRPVPFTPPRHPAPPTRATTAITSVAVRALPVAGALLALLAIGALAGCGAPPELHDPAGLPTGAGTPTAPSSTGVPTGTPSTVPSAPPAVTPSASREPGLVATACRNGPTGQRVVQLLKGRASVLPDNVRVRVRTGPLCAADWQYTVLEVTGHEELQVVTRGRPAAPELVTAGTDVCTIEVRATGPAGIRTLACDDDPAARPGA